MTSSTATGHPGRRQNHSSQQEHNLYLDVSCVRIQSYLSRTTQLKGRRGASAAIAAATQLDADAGRELLRALPGVAANTEAGEADGVINLVVQDTSVTDSTDTTAREIARTVFRRLRALLPAAEFQAVWATGPSYLDAHHNGIGPRLARGDVLSDLPPVPELPYARPCGMCHLDPAAGTLRLGPDDEQPACADCLARWSPQGRLQGRTAERALATALGHGRLAEDLSDLARLGGRDNGRNHVGTVFVDGNAFGEFFEGLATQGRRVDRDTKTAISRDLNQHTRTALAEAAHSVVRDSDRDTLCVVPYLVGGDDVLVSLPADRAWAFSRRYLSVFATLVAQTRDAVGVPGLPRLSASAGLVFAHAKEPFHLVVEEAGRRLAAAKSAVRGSAASVAFADLTRGETGAPVRLSDLEAHADALTRLAALPAGSRHTLASRLGSGSTYAETAVANQALRLGQDDVLAPFLAEEAPIGLDQALRITRWWR
ncbi:Cas10/Cmr2 second palm domain-containing protein [Streptomyces sp. NPDC001680]